MTDTVTIELHVNGMPIGCANAAVRDVVRNIILGAVTAMADAHGDPQLRRRPATADGHQFVARYTTTLQDIQAHVANGGGT